MKECLYNYQDKVKFQWKDGAKDGYIEIIDRFGTFEQRDEPSYDIMNYEDACLYKHVPQSLIVCKMEDDGLVRGTLFIDEDVFSVGHARNLKVEVSNQYTQMRIVGWLDWMDIEQLQLKDWVGYKVEVR